MKKEISTEQEVHEIELRLLYEKVICSLAEGSFIHVSAKTPLSYHQIYEKLIIEDRRNVRIEVSGLFRDLLDHESAVELELNRGISSLTVQTVNGDVELQDLILRDADLSSETGAITGTMQAENAQIITGGLIDLSLSGGSFLLRNNEGMMSLHCGAFETMNASDTSGRMEIDLQEDFGYLELSSKGGEIIIHTGPLSDINIRMNEEEEPFRSTDINRIRIFNEEGSVRIL